MTATSPAAPVTGTATARVDAIHHLAASTADMKGVIDFYTQVLGMELVGLFPMHGVPGAIHSFLRLDDRSSLSFVFMPAIADIDEQLGVTHAANAADTTAPGTMQHLAFGVSDRERLLAMRDRIRGHGYRVMGPIDHGFCQSIYFRGPEGALLEVSWYVEPIDPRRWIDPEVVRNCGITDDELARYVDPPPFEGQDGYVPQPPEDPARPDVRNPAGLRALLDALDDDQVEARFSYATPPVPDPDGA
jgi:catechol 2,3-dioxygenase-like lactoylglutathione lyase family enzyme